VLIFSQRKVSLSTLQSKAARRRDDAQRQQMRGAGAARNKTSHNAHNSLLAAAKANGFTGMSAVSSERNRLDDPMELEIIQVDTVQTPQRRKVAYMYQCSLFCTAGVGKRIRSTSLYHSRQRGIALI